jgi:hypothetical protein
MAWEVFTKKVIRTGSPVVTLGKMGRVAFNMQATGIFEANHVTHVLLLWDKESHRCAAKVAQSKEPGAYKLTYNVKYNGAGFSAVTFLNYIKYDWTETRAYNAEWDANAKMLIFEIPAEHLGKPVPAGYLTRTGSIKRGDRVKANTAGQEELELKNQEATEVTP